MKSLFGSFTSFLGKYAGELSLVSSALTKLVESSSMARDDRAGVKKVVETLQQNVASIEEWAKKAKEPVTVKISKKDIEDAVAKLLPDMIAKVVEEKASEPAK